MRAEKWEPIDGIDSPCGQIAFSYVPDGTATVSMAFNESARPASTLILRFRNVVVLAGEDEAPGGFVAAPAVQSLPKLERGHHPSWTFPLMKLFDSPSLNQYQLMRSTPLAHFFLVSLDNLVHVIAGAQADASWASSAIPINGP